MGLRGPMLRRSTDPISALTGCHAPARGAGRTAHAPGSPTPPLGPLGPQERAGDRRGARRAPPAEPPERQRHCRLRWRGSRAPARARARPRRARGLRMRRPPSPSSRWQSARACRRVGGVVEGKVAGGRNSAAVAPPALIEYRALRRRRKAGLVRHGHHPCRRPCLPPPLPPFAALPPPRAAVGAACWASMLSLLGTGTWNARYMFERPPGFKRKIAGALSQPLRPPGTRGRRRGALGGPF